ncbi:shikimate dehydrogenase [Pedobacter cryoconitis]|uniref:Shikimate dehydrogenase n=1 Tax=Pedobacter cryoconitis TaxID=188932 RepID=A0A7W8YVE5_9SPHI|nr:shikimate dehydrogenase [Pedobacter cryoconitis]MBB5622511.1 shikimate dehydrogenase [Pedobacter cryoconitis]MBB5647687.1 shikimate dehydrogenase [Pedobacter cryoconitis]
MRTFGLIGYPLAHSFSKKFFTEKFAEEGIADHQYELFPIENIAAVVSLIAADDSLAGLNVTIPHKVGVMTYLNELDPAAETIGAVNCISIQHKDGQTWLKGFNTDAYGFQESLKPYLKKHHTHALILGDGGAAKAVKYVLDQLQITYLSVVRTVAPNAILYSDLTEDLLQKHQVIINTTPLGTFPNVEAAPAIPYQWLTDQHLAYDLVYNPEETEFLKRAKAKGAAIKNGFEMLQLQAERSWFIWNP